MAVPAQLKVITRYARLRDAVGSQACTTKVMFKYKGDKLQRISTVIFGLNK